MSGSRRCLLLSIGIFFLSQGASHLRPQAGKRSFGLSDPLPNPRSPIPGPPPPTPDPDPLHPKPPLPDPEPPTPTPPVPDPDPPQPPPSPPKPPIPQIGPLAATVFMTGRKNWKWAKKIQTRSFANFVLLGLSVMMIGMTGCSRYHVVPEHLEDGINTGLSFDRIREAPEQYRGELLVVGGTVLSLKHEERTTRLDLHRLPLTDEYVPISVRTTNRDRFLAVCSGADLLDPEILRPGTTLTIVGEVKGSQSIRIGDRDQAVPVFDIRDLTIWDHPDQEGPDIHGGHWFPTLYAPYGYRPDPQSNC